MSLRIDDLTQIRSSPRPCCPSCGADGIRLYDHVEDRLWGAPGVWDLSTCSASDCELAWLDPTPTEDDLWKAYQTYYTHSVSERPPGPFLKLLDLLRKAYLRGWFGYAQGVGPAWSGALAAPAALVFRVLPGGLDSVEDTACCLPSRGPGARLLEVGFGNGNQLERMRALGWDVEGVDPDPVSIESALARGLRVHRGDLPSQQFPDRTFDAVYLSHVIEHVHDPEGLLRECHRILRPGGRVVVITPNLRSLGHRTFGRDWVNLDPPRHLVLLSTPLLRRIAERAGFSVVRMRTSARIAWLVWIGSLEIGRFGRVVSLNRWPRLYHACAALGAQFAQAALLGICPDLGEEIVLVAQKPS